MSAQALLYLVGGLVLLFGGADGLVRGGSALALRLGLTPLVIGLTVVAFGTSAPELVVSAEAVIAYRGPIALGNVIGSNIANIALILGMAAIVRPPRVVAQLVRLDVPLLLGLSFLLLLLLSDGMIGRVEAGGLAAGLVAYLVLIFYLARQQRRADVEVALEAVQEPRGPAFLEILLVVLGLAVLIMGARFIIVGAVVIADALAVDQAVIALTVVAVGTSLPELATSVVAALRDEGDIAVGNVVGSSIFNILGVLGVAGLIRPFGAEAIGSVDLWLMALLPAVLLVMMLTSKRIVRAEGVALLMIYTIYLIHLAGGL